MATNFSIDSLAIRNGRVFGWGWFLDERAAMRQGELRLPLQEGGELVVPCLDGAARSDVAAAFPSIDHAAASGFMLMAAAQGAIDAARGARFIAELADGNRVELRLDSWPGSGGPDAVERPRASQVVARLREEGPRRTAQAARAHLVRRASAFVRTLHAHRWQRFRGGATVVFDHAMGGGANVYRDALVEARVREGRRVVLVTPHLATLDYRIRVIDGRGERAEWREPDDHSLIASLERLDIVAIEVNNLVTFADPLLIVGWCVRRRQAGARLDFHLHDFHAVCPAFTLVNPQGRYCGVPALDACRSCLPMNAANSLGLGQGADMERWREGWAQLLLAADQVTAFSEASARILARAYPELMPRIRIRVKPHEPSLRRLRAIAPGGSAILKIGVVGNISRAKGADIVAGIVALARERALPVQVVVVGTLQISCPQSAHLVIHGPFHADELPDLMEQYGIDVCLMPSVCPETYSYVTDEIMAMGLPIAVFDIGAPAERVARYALGQVMTEVSADAALADIMRLAERARGHSAMNRQEQR